ncbi:MAG TPA: transglycosylase domain-containing protein [Streptosporangiaceae bacterium]|nr:transglycosylase domain-containing protein [Streptosporangiaceae bacterium]
MLSGQIANKTGVVGRLISISAVGGLIAAAMALPVVATTGVVLRDQANKAAAPASASFGTIPQRSEIYDANGHLMAYVYGINLGKNANVTGLDRQPVTYSQISPTMRRAVVAIEDNRYWSEGALDLKGTLRALVNDLQHKAVQGGSSITQQYVKNMLILTATSKQQQQAAFEETLSRKLHELRLAITVAHQQSKPQILTGYLNDAYFGNQAYGIEVAAETYFGTTAAKLTLPQSALLAGMVENPTGYNPFLKPATAKERRNTVLARMVQTGVLDAKTAATAEQAPLGVSNNTPDNGCTASRAGTGAFFCNYVEHVFVNDATVAKTPQARASLLATGGLKIYTTLDEEDQNATANAVNYVLPDGSHVYNPANNAETEVLVQPGTGYIKAMAENRTYGSSGTTINYAVDTPYGGLNGVQTGSSAKLFTLVTALEQNIPFGFTLTVPGQTTVTGFTNCKGEPVGYANGQLGVFPVVNAEGPGGSSTQSLYTGTAQSVNTFFANLERKVGLCNVVKTAAAMGLHRVDGTSLLNKDPALDTKDNPSGGDPADDVTSFTLGPVNVSPLSMATAYATVAANGKYCAPTAITKIVSETGKSLAVPSSNCHQAIPTDIAEAVNYVLQGVLTAPGATGATLGIGRPAAGKTGTSNVEGGNGGTPYAAFAGYTPTLASYTSAFNPESPTGHTMAGETACYHSPALGLDCPSQMFGADAPGHTWQMTFEHANLGSDAGFAALSPSSQLFRMGNGQVVKQPAKPKAKGKGKGGGTNGKTTSCVFNICFGNGTTGNGNGNGGPGANGGPVN